jgi:thiol-disulfide isomerase/thioredoxin
MFATDGTLTTKSNFKCTFNGIAVDTLVVMEINNPAGYAGNIVTPKQSTVLPDVNGNFNFQIYDMGEGGKTRVLLLFNMAGKIIPVMSNYYLSEAGDSIHLEINKSNNVQVSVTYSGIGAEKYTCAKKIDSLFSHTDIWRIWNDTNQQLWTISNFIKTKEKASAFPGFSLLEKYRNRMSNQAYQVLYADVLGRLLTNLDLITSRLFFKSNTTEKKILMKEFTHLLNINLRSPEVKYQLFSMAYFNFLMARTGSELYWEKREADVSLIDAYEQIKQKYKGVLREYMLTVILSFGNRFPKNLAIKITDSLWKDCFVLVKEEILETFILNRITRKAKGREGFNFSLPDKAGNKISLNDLKGHVVLLDFWFTGCGGCAGYSKRLEQYVYPEFQQDSSIVFVSICADKDIQVWLQSMQTNTYTRKENVNLYTDGLGFEHPMMKYYDINGAPFSLLFDRQGKIYAGNPPTNDMAMLISLIKKAKGPLQ